MLSRLSVRGKFLAALGVPIVVLFLAASFLTWQSVSSWREADQTNALLGALTAQDAVGDDLASERVYSLQYLATGSAAVEQQLADARKKTDADLATLNEMYGGLNLSALDPKVRTQVDETIKISQNVAALRTRVDDKSASAVEMISGYSTMIVQGLRVPTAVAQTTNDRKLALYIDAYESLDSYLAQLSLSGPIGGQLLAQVAAGTVDDSLRVQAATFATGAVGSREAAATAVEALPGDLVLPESSSTYTKVVRAIAGGQPEAVVSAAGQWNALWQEEAASVAAVRDTVRTDTSGVANDSANSARNQALITAGGTLLAVALSVLIAWMIARGVGGRLRRLTASARNVREQLPMLVEHASTPGQRSTFDLAPISVESHDEVGELASAFNEVNATTVAVAREQAALRESIAEMFVNVARRDQVLLNRQLAFLDDLERTEQDPNELSNLFRLDHLATRMRRNAESLLILAGIDSGRRVREPMPLSDVVRTAASEIELFDRVRLNLGVDPMMLGHNALNAAHLLAELLENSTQLSEPHAPVEVTADFDGQNVNLVIRDSGVGMSDEELAMATHYANSFSSAEVIGTQRLGLHVVGRLANRIGAKVSFAPGPDGTGTTTSIALPIELFVQDSSMPVTTPAARPAAPQTPPSDQPHLAADQPQAATDQPQFGAPAGQPQFGAPTGQPQFGAPAEPQVANGFPQFSPTQGGASTLPAETEPPDAMPVDLDALTDGTTPTGMPRRKTSRSDAGIAAPSAVVGDQPVTDGIVLPPLETPEFTFDATSEEAWVPPEPVAGSISLPSRQRGQVPEEDLSLISGEETLSLDVNERTGLFSSFRSMEDLGSAVEDGTEHIALDSSAAAGASDFDLSPLPASTSDGGSAGPGWMADLMDETVIQSTSSASLEEAYQPVFDPPADASLPLIERPAVEPDVPTEVMSATPQASGPIESLPSFDDLISDSSAGQLDPYAGWHAQGPQSEAPSTDSWLGEDQAQTAAPAEQAAGDYADGLTAPEPYSPQGQDRLPEYAGEFGQPYAPLDSQQADHAGGFDTSAPYAPLDSQQQADYAGGFDTSAPYVTESASPFEEVSPTRENPLADVGRYAEQARTPATSYAPGTGSEAPTEQIEPVPEYEPAGYGEALDDPLTGPLRRDASPVAPGEAPLGEWGAPSPLVRRHARGLFESDFGEDSVEAHSEWMASAVVFEEMSSLLRRGDSLGAHSAEPATGYQPERMDSELGQSGTGLTRRHRLAGTDASHDRFTARIERDPEQLRSKLSAFQSATARGRAVAAEHQNRPDDVQHVTEPTSHTW